MTNHVTEIEREIARLTAVIDTDPRNADALYRRGALYWKLGHRAKAQTDFCASAELDPAGPGAVAARGVSGIFNFFNPDIYNP